MGRAMGPLLSASVNDSLLAARAAGRAALECSLDLGRSTTRVAIDGAHFTHDGTRYPFLEVCKPRTIYYWTAAGFAPVARFTTALIKLVPTEWGAPTFEIDGIKMLATARLSPVADAERKVALIRPRGKRILDTCGGLGYFAACCLSGQSVHVHSYEKNPDVIWLRSLNPWSPDNDDAPAIPGLTLWNADVTEAIARHTNESVDAVLHDPPRFGIAGELYSQAFYDQLARVLKRRGKLFHYTGAPNKVSSGRDLQQEVAARLRRSGFTADLCFDGVFGIKSGGIKSGRA